MTSLNPSLRLALINKAKHQKNIFSKGFTLVELMVTVAIVGLLSGVAVPQFLAFQQDAKERSAFLEVIGLAKECATARKLGRLYPDAYPTSLTAGVNAIVNGNCTKGSTSDLTFKSIEGGAVDQKCGNVAVSTAGQKCQIVVASDGAQTFTTPAT
jgi:prepilin-type N-terminal cleavage/methylation domain-containing protein